MPTTEWDPYDLRRNVGYVLQEIALFPHMSIAENIAVVPRLRGWDDARVAARVRELLELTGLGGSDFATRRPHELSGGQRQRVGVARALAADPPILLMDEPFGALDPMTRREMHEQLRRIQEQVRKTILIVTHDMGEAFAMGTRVGVLADGALAALDTPRAIARSEDPRVEGPAGAVVRGDRRAPGQRTVRLIEFWRSHAAELASLLGQHVFLVGVSTLAAVLIGVPIGLLAAKRPRLGAPVVWLANVAQTIPSLAMFGFLLPLPFVGGLGARVAITVLVLYALLPIIRTTVAGMRSIDASLVEAGLALGMTPGQLFRRVELPLALPSIVAGIRVATVIGVGTATIAAAVGAGGLGEYIFRGLSMVEPTVILAGAVPAALLALTFDGGLMLLERGIRRAIESGGSGRVRTIAIAGALAIAAAAGVALAVMRPDADVIRVGSKNFTEQIVLGELLAQTIERQTDLKVERRLNLGGTFICDQALRSGDIDVYVEYSGTALTAVFHQPVETDPSRVLDAIRQRYARGRAHAARSARLREHVRDPGPRTGRGVLPT